MYIIYIHNDYHIFVYIELLFIFKKIREYSYCYYNNILINSGQDYLDNHDSDTGTSSPMTPSYKNANIQETRVPIDTLERHVLASDRRDFGFTMMFFLLPSSSVNIFIFSKNISIYI